MILTGVVPSCGMQKCDAGPGDAAYTVEIPRKKGNTVGTFRLCEKHRDNVLRLDPCATYREIEKDARPSSTVLCADGEP